MPTENSSMFSRDECFLRLQEKVGKVARGELLIMMGDMNVRVGNDTGVRGEVLGRHGGEVCNDRKWGETFTVQQ